MATVTTNNQYYTDIANAIRGKNGTEIQYKPSEMAAAIQAISGGGEPEPPDDGKTRLYITVPANAMEGLPPPRNQVPLYIQQTVANGVTIDWGDGTPTETLPGVKTVNTTHTYEQAGDYIISLDPAEGCVLGLGVGGSSSCVMGSTDDNNSVYRNMLQKVIINNASIEGSAFYSCYSLASVVIPNEATSIGDNAFRECYSLASVVIPDGVTSIEASVFFSCYSLASITIPDGVTSIGNYAFRECYSLASVVIPDGVTSIGSYAFYNCKSVKEYHFFPATPPTLANTNAFSGIPSDCIIYVPVGSLQAYQTATNWATYADQMQEEPA